MEERASQTWTKGLVLDAQAVRQTRREDMQNMEDMKVFSPPASSRTIPCRWIDHDKGRAGEPCMRSRLLACEIRTRSPDLTAVETFASTPPLECLRLVISFMSQPEAERAEDDFVLAIGDVSRACLHAPVTRQVTVRLPRDLGEFEDDMMN